MSRPWDDVDDDGLLELLGAALAPSRDDVVPIVRSGGEPPMPSPGRRWRWVAAAAAVLVVAIGASVALRSDGGERVEASTPTTAPTPTTTAIEAVRSLADDLEAILGETLFADDLPRVAALATDLREARERAGLLSDAVLATRVDDLLALADAVLRPPPETTTSTAPVVTPPSSPVTAAPTTTSTTVDDHGGDDDENSGPGGGGDDDSGPDDSHDDSGPGGGSDDDP
jgi:hypothetical protein